MLMAGYKNTSALSAFIAQAKKNIAPENSFDNEVFEGNEVS